MKVAVLAVYEALFAVTDPVVSPDGPRVTVAVKLGEEQLAGGTKPLLAQ